MESSLSSLSVKQPEKEWENHVSLHVIDLLCSSENFKDKKDDLFLDLNFLDEIENDFVEKLSIADL